MMSFLTLVVLDLRPATTTLPGVTSRRSSTWTTGMWLSDGSLHIHDSIDEVLVVQMKDLQKEPLASKMSSIR